MSFWLFIFPILPLTAPSLHLLILPLLTLKYVSAFPTLFKLCLNTLHLLKLFHDHFTYPHLPIHRSTCLARVTISSFKKASPIHRSTCLARMTTSSFQKASPNHRSTCLACMTISSFQKASPIYRSTCLACMTISSFQKASPIYRSTCLAHIATSCLPLLYNTSPKEVSSLHVLCLLPNKHLSPAAYLNFNFHGLVFTSMK